jgi:hypothetical protein
MEPAFAFAAISRFIDICIDGFRHDEPRAVIYAAASFIYFENISPDSQSTLRRQLMPFFIDYCHY